MSYNLKELLTLEELDENELAGPLRYLYWKLARLILIEPKMWEKYMMDMTSDERFCVQNPTKHRELRDRLTISLVRGNPMREEPVTELMWSRFISGLVLLKINHCTLKITARRKLKKTTLEKDVSISFNPMSLYVKKQVSSSDSVKGVGTRIKEYLENPAKACEEMNHPLGLIYWGLVKALGSSNNWEIFMEKYLTNPEYCVQLKQMRNDKFSNIKKAICNRENLTWRRLIEALVALDINEIDIDVTVTDVNEVTYETTHTVIMKDVKFIKVGGEDE